MTNTASTLANFYTAQEVSQALGLARSTIYYLTQSEQLSAVRVGGRWRYRASDIEKYLSTARNSSEKIKQKISALRAQERRRGRRVLITVPCTVTVQVGDRKRIIADGEIRDVSDSGLCVGKLHVKQKFGTMEEGDPITIDSDTFGKLKGRILRLQQNRMRRIILTLNAADSNLASKIKI